MPKPPKVPPDQMYEDFHFFQFKRQDQIRKMSIITMSLLIIYFSITGPVEATDAIIGIIIATLTILSSILLMIYNIANALERCDRTTHLWLEVLNSVVMIGLHVYLLNCYVTTSLHTWHSYLGKFFMFGTSFNIFVYLIALTKQLFLMDLIFFF